MIAARKLSWGIMLVIGSVCLPVQAAEAPLRTVVREVQSKLVKIHGAGGARGLEAYHTGIMISPEGHILTVWSYVLDTDKISVTLPDGRRRVAELVGMNPVLEIAVLKIEAEQLPCFALSETASLTIGNRVLAFSNLYGVAAGNEAVSVQHGVVAAQMDLSAKRGIFATPYRGSVYVLDAITNNPGAAGGALTNREGQLCGLLGKELRSRTDNTWLNYALPAPDLKSAVDDILAGKATAGPRQELRRKPSAHHSLAQWGLELVPDVLPKTPPFVDRVVAGSTAEKAGIQPDDLILFLNGDVVASCQALEESLLYIDVIDTVTLTLQRGQELKEISLRAK